MTLILTLDRNADMVHEVAKLLKNARREAGLSQRALARRAGVSHGTINAYEHGRKTPNMTTLANLLTAATGETAVLTAVFASGLPLQ
jgi:transcriptional regulator with XRE-family HTH domain